MEEIPYASEAPPGRVDRFLTAGVALLAFTVPLVFSGDVVPWAEMAWLVVVAVGVGVLWFARRRPGGVERLMAAVPALLFFSLAFLFGPLSEKVATPPKIFWAQTVILFLCFLWFAKMNARGDFVFRPTPIFWALAIYLGAQALSLFKATNAGYGFFELRVFLFWFIAYLLVTNHLTERNIRKLLGVIVLAGAIASVYGILQHYGKDFVDWGVTGMSVDAMSAVERVRFDKTMEALAQGPATFGHNNFAAHYLIMALPVAVAMILTSRRWQARSLYGIALLVMLFHLNITLCRGAVVGLGIGVVVCLPLMLQRVARLSRSSLRRWFVFAGGVVCAIVLVLLLTGKTNVMMEQFRKGIDTPYVSRTAIWQSGFRAFLDAPVLGVGKGNFEIATPAYWTESAKAVFSDHLEMGIQAHNEYLEIAVETGLVGLGAFLWFVICLGSSSISLWRKRFSNERRIIVLCIICAVTGVLAHSLVSFNLQTPASALTFFMLVGVIDVFALKEEPRKAVVRLKGSRSRVLRTVVWIILAGFIPAWWFFTAAPFLAKARILDGSEAMSNGNAEQAVRHFQDAVRFAPWNWDSSFKLGNAYARTGEYDRAVEHFNRSLDANPNYVLTHANLGRAYFNLGETEKAEDSARQAASLVPEFPAAHDVLGLCYAKQERWEEALEEFKAAVDLPKAQRRQLHWHMAMCYYKLGLFDESVAEYDRAIEAGSAAAPKFHVEKGSVLLEVKEYQRAAESLREAIDLFQAKGQTPASNPFMLKAYVKMARVCLKGLEPPRPFLASVLVLELSRYLPDRQSVRALTDVLYQYLTRHDFSQEGAIAAWYHVGGAYLHQKRYDRTEECLTLLIESGEPNARILRLAYHDLALAAARKNEPDRALEIIDKGKKIAPDFAPLDQLRDKIVAWKESAGQGS